MSPDRPFDSYVIFAEMRTGSNFLEENLNAVPGVRCHGEAFNPHFVGHKGRDTLLGVDQTTRDRDPGTLLDAMIRADGGLAGFRFFHDHDPRVFDRVLADRRCAKIVLTRNPAETYVSRKIAGETGQWRLTDIKHARSARVRFDAREFADHLDRLQGFQLRLMRGLQTSGQTAFYLAYEDVADLDVLNGLLHFLGVEARLGAVSDRLKKQNPEPLSKKVVNFSEMEAALAALDRFDLTRTPCFEPRRGPAVPGHVAAPETPLLFLPIAGGPVARIESWLAALDGKKTGALRRGFTQKTLRQWKRQAPGHRAFTVVMHPLVRAHAAFAAHVLPTGPGSFPVIRAALRKSYGVPLPEGDPGPAYGAAAHRAAFLGFLRFLHGNLAGQTGLRVDASWASQSRVLDGMTQAVQPDMVLRAEHLETELAMLAALVGAAPPALPAATDDGAPVPLAAVYDDEIEAAAHAAYQRDYLEFGYGAWRT
ncbi:nodulation protein NodH [Rhodovulum euryhalinum]|uniref:LPS sulfotransferase NodH n=1 Tax=Rhodovulum euryhalinum TaxID=35805 RepID=A0A4R2KHH5_9RHOB|nr:nodulation protein NodH [Rhodovulum euryhalinum]TCO69939.1 LPS sulfotransferase NodH [Rhodovulum euryhalinum]